MKSKIKKAYKNIYQVGKKRKTKVFYCIDCGKKVCKLNGLCMSCSIKRVPRTPEWKENISKARRKEWASGDRKPAVLHHSDKTKNILRDITSKKSRDNNGKFLRDKE